MFRRYVQRNEIMPFILYLRPIGNSKTHPAENLHQLAYGLRNDMAFALTNRQAGQRYIDHRPGTARGAQEGPLLLKCLVHLCFDAIG